MSETFAASRARLLGSLGKQDPFGVPRRTPARLERLTAGRRRQRLTRRSNRGGWPPLEIIGHMADAELAFGGWLRNCPATPGLAFPGSIRASGHSGCGTARGHCGKSWPDSGRIGRATWLGCAVPQRARRAAFGVHERRGGQTVLDFVRMEAAHDLNHLREIRAVLHAVPART